MSLRQACGSAAERHEDEVFVPGPLQSLNSGEDQGQARLETKRRRHSDSVMEFTPTTSRRRRLIPHSKRRRDFALHVPRS